MANILLAAVLLLPRYIWASPVHLTQRNFGTCTQFNVAVDASTTGYIFDLPKVDSDLDAVAWALNADTWSSPSPLERVLENITISGTYNIYTQLCIPRSGGDVLQIATHGGHYDSRYWDADVEGHSYVNAALEAGYSILTYDRLSTGHSDKPDAYTVAQAQVELEILRQLTMKARSGSFGVNPRKIVHVGHSFGSVLTSAFIGEYPLLSDGAIITGFLENQHFGSGMTPWSVRYATDRPSGYVYCQKSGIQTIFFAGDFTQELLDYGDEIKQPIPLGEITSGAFLLLAHGSFTGPIHYMLPELDFFVCTGDCKEVVDLNSLKARWPNATAVEVDIQPNTGHALPLHNNATAGFQVSFDFLGRNGL